MTWYDPAELKDEAEKLPSDQVSPEFAPEVPTSTETHTNKELGEWTTRMQAFKAEFDANYTP